MYRESHENKYKVAAKQIRDRLKTYPRTEDGGIWHATSTSRHTSFGPMGVHGEFPFWPGMANGWTKQRTRTTKLQSSSSSTAAIASRECCSTCLRRIAHPELVRSEDGAFRRTLVPRDRVYGMSTIDVLEILPPITQKRNSLISNLEKLGRRVQNVPRRRQRAVVQVVDKGNLANNWTETSCSSMYTYTISRAWSAGTWTVPTAMSRQGIPGGSPALSLEAMARQRDGISVGTNVGRSRYIGSLARNQ